MENYFYKLPQELQRYIYSYDSTYYNIVKEKRFKEELLQLCLTSNFRLKHFERRILDYIYSSVVNGDLFWFENDIITTGGPNIRNSKYLYDIEDIHKDLKINFYFFQDFITFKLLPKKYNLPKNDIKYFDGFVSTTAFLDNCVPTNYTTSTSKQMTYMNRFVNYILEDVHKSTPFQKFLEPLHDLNEDEQKYDLFYIWMNLS